MNLPKIYIYIYIYIFIFKFYPDFTPLRLITSQKTRMFKTIVLRTSSTYLALQCNVRESEHQTKVHAIFIFHGL